MRDYLYPTLTLDAFHESILETAHQVAEVGQSETENAVKLFYFVRDTIAYNLYVPRFAPEDFMASNTLARGSGFCIQKAVLLAALGRALSIPTRLGFAVIRNHRLPEKLIRAIGSNEIPDHGYTELYLDGQWVKATPAFDLNTCRERGFRPVEFDGASDAVFHSTTQDGDPHIEYVKDLGRYADLPFDEIMGWVAHLASPELLEIFGGRA